jgi:peroxiredoxin
VSHIFGVSTQDTAYQQELKERVHLRKRCFTYHPDRLAHLSKLIAYQLLSDEKLELQKALKLPTFEFQGDTLIKRMVLGIEDGKVVHVRYPDFPPDRSAANTVEWLKSRAGREKLSTSQEDAMLRNLQKK